MDIESELELKIKELKREFGDLLDEDALRRLALEEMGLNDDYRRWIADLKDGEVITIVVTVVKIDDTREVILKDGSPRKVRDMIIGDDSGTCKFTLWGEDTSLPESLGISEGDRIILIDCYVKRSDYGLQITRGRSGCIEKRQ